MRSMRLLLARLNETPGRPSMAQLQRVIVTMIHEIAGECAHVCRPPPAAGRMR